MLQSSIAVAWPWQSEIITRGVIARYRIFAATRLQGLRIEYAHHPHVGFEALWCLSCIANRPNSAVDLTQDGFNFRFLPILAGVFCIDHFVVKRQLFTEAKAVGKLLHEDVVRHRLKQWIYHFFTPLNRAIGSRNRSGGFELRTCWQQIHGAIFINLFAFSSRHCSHRRCRAWIWVNYDQ